MYSYDVLQYGQQKTRLAYSQIYVSNVLGKYELRNSSSTNQ